MTNYSKNDQRLPSPRDIPLAIDDWIAECQSLQPDRTIGIRDIGTSWDALCLIYIISHVGNLFWITDSILRKISQKAYQSNYEGGWKTVQEILEQNPQTPEEFYWQFLQSHSPEEFFGNLKRRSKRMILLIRFYRRDPHGPVRKPQRARGYKDKGTLRPPHKRHGDPPEKKEKVDRRGMVGHPLLREEEYEKTSGDNTMRTLEVKT